MIKAEGVVDAVDRIGGQPIAARIARKAPIRHLDPMLLLVTLLLGALGALMVLSATASKQREAGLDPETFFDRQVAYLIGGALIVVALTLFDYRRLRAFAPIVYGLMVVALVVVFTPLGEVRSGARRWISFGAFEAQPSEFAKVAVVVTLAALLADRKGDVRARDVIAACGLVLLPMGLIYLEPDLGTLASFVFVAAAMLLVAGARLRHFLVIGLLGAAAVLAVLQFHMLKDYQVERLTAFLDPHPDVRSVGYNLTQSKIAIGSGGLYGKGLHGENTQTALDFVPEQHTDFIFTAVGEQLGFVGSATLLLLFALLIWRALRIAALARDMFGTLIAAGVASLWAIQLFVNVGMTMGIMPITGIPLPLISYGGSSLVTNLIAVGLLLNIHMRRFQ